MSQICWLGLGYSNHFVFFGAISKKNSLVHVSGVKRHENLKVPEERASERYYKWIKLCIKKHDSVEFDQN